MLVIDYYRPYCEAKKANPKSSSDTLYSYDLPVLKQEYLYHHMDRITLHKHRSEFCRPFERKLSSILLPVAMELIFTLMYSSV